MAAGTTLGETGEFRLIEAITADAPGGPQVLLGPGDDAAILDLHSPVLTSVDLLVEGVHFRRDWSSAAEIGRKAIAVNVADIEAMGGRAVAVVVGCAVPPDLETGWLLELAGGLKTECATAGVAMVGGDLTRGRDVTISVTVTGQLDGGPAVLRSGAAPGQVVALVGRTGWAAAGLVVLGRGFRSPRVVVDAHKVPQVPYGEGRRAAAAGATALIDVSDGLLADLGHIARASTVSIDVARDAFEVPESLQAVAAATGSDPYALILTGGEDHALVACFPDTASVPDGWRVVGRTLEPGENGPVVTVDGAPWEAAAGWDHFRAVRR